MFVFRVWSVRYNHFHDQLVLSSSSDSRVVLNNIVSLSSEPYGHLLENDDDSDEDKDDNRYLAEYHDRDFPRPDLWPYISPFNRPFPNSKM